YNLDWNKLISIGEHNSFKWTRPEHMEPTGQLTMNEVKEKLDSQLHECLNYLQQMPDGEGVLCKTTMTVNNLGKIDVYHYIYFLVQHGKRHITQMEKIKAEMEGNQ
ncbi:MAG: DinB family protein, partial [Bacteroidota bacterium]